MTLNEGSAPIRAGRIRFRRAARQAICAAALLLPAALLSEAGMGAEVRSEESGMTDAIRLHKGKPFYEERPEVEQSFEGWLRKAPVMTGPDTRDLPIHLELEGGNLAIYALGETAERLGPHLDRRVRIVGKQVDLRNEGGGVELWPSSVADIGS